MIFDPKRDKNYPGGTPVPEQHLKLGTAKALGSNARPAALTRFSPTRNGQSLISLNAPKPSSNIEQTNQLKEWGISDFCPLVSFKSTQVAQDSAHYPEPTKSGSLIAWLSLQRVRVNSLAATKCQGQPAARSF